MLNKKLALSSLTVASLMAFSAQASHSFDSRSYGMGGTGVSSSDYLTSVFHNPALGARYKSNDDVGILIPSVGAQLMDSDDVVTKLDDFSDLYDTLEGNPTVENAQTVVDALKDMQGNQAFIQAGVGAAIAIPTQYFSVNLYGKAYVDAFAMADISDNDLDANQLATDVAGGNTQLDSQGLVVGVAVMEGGVAISKGFEVPYGTWYVGVTPKYQTVKTINYSVSMDSFDADDWDDEKYQSEDSNFNFDVGIAFEMPEGFVFGLVGKNLIEHTYKTSNVSGVSGEYTINPIYTVGASFNHDLFTVAADVDLNENKRFETMSGLVSGTHSADYDNTQMAGIGAEFNAWDWAQLRVGYQHDIAGTLDDQFTAGIGVSPFGAVHIDLSASYAGENQFGAVVQTYFTF